MPAHHLILSLTVLCLFPLGAEASTVEQACHLNGLRSEVRCGKLPVPLNYENPAAGTLSLNYAVIPALRSDGPADPLFFLAGGPGQAAVDVAGMITGAFSEVRQQRDLVLIDQRGTGQSAALRCGTPDLPPFASVSDDNTRQLIGECLDELGADVIHFSTANSVRDLESLRIALGYEQINLYGGSYGSRLGLVYMKHYPQFIRAAVLDSLGPTQIPIGPFGQSSARSFDLLLAECEANQRCRDAFPQLRNTFSNLADRLMESPVSTEVTHPTLGTATPFDLTFDVLVGNLRMLLYSPHTRQILPLVIQQTAMGNYAPLVGVIAQTIELSEQIAVGLNLNIICNEDFPRISAADWAQDADNLFGGAASHRPWQLLCKDWPRYAVPDEFGEPVVSNIPSLLLSGEMDPVTPPSNGEKALAGLSRGRHLEVPNGAHTVTFHSCARDIVSDFLNAPEKLYTLDISCLEDTPPTRFMLTLNDGG